MSAERSLLSESEQWKASLRPEGVLRDALEGVDDETLVKSYITWWQVYTAGIRNAPSSRDGVSAYDARAAAEDATTAVLQDLETRTS